MKKNIMIIDDSALMRRVLSDIINTTEQYQVVYAATNGRDALEAMQRLTPIHFIFLDINMPVMDGVELLRRMKQNKIRIPTVVFSTVAERSSSETIEALSLGAVDFLKKPENILVNMSYFRKKVLKALSIIETDHEPSIVVKEVRQRKRRQNDLGRGKLVAIACSTGGPKALQEIIPYLPADLDAAVVIVQHMPEGFTASLAERLNDRSKMPVKEAAEGDILENGHVYIAKGGRHLRIQQAERGQHVLRLGDDEPVMGLRPYANYMYESLIQSGYYEIVCVVLTGMGADGTRGIGRLCQEKNVYVISQDKESSTVYGMPKMVAQSGLSDEVVSLDQMAKAIINYTGVC